MIELDDVTFRDFINGDFVLVEFYTDYCPHCRTLTAMLEPLCKENGIKGGKINVNKFREIREEFEIELVPTVIVFSKGESIGGFMGLTSPGTARKELLRLASSVTG
ncbi:MAG: thioredoxin family protein [Halobacteriota archaeon]